jgi:hypothetical protein
MRGGHEVCKKNYVEYNVKLLIESTDSTSPDGIYGDKDSRNICVNSINEYNDFCRLMADNTKLPAGWEVINKDII